MSLTSAEYTGISGLLSNATALNVEGNNLANTNTVGFKGGDTLFSTMLSSTIGNNSQVGNGVQVQAVQNDFSAGTYQSSTSVTDMAIQGNGFFALAAPGTTSATASTAYYTQAGSFNVNSNLDLVNPDGYLVLDTQGNPIQFSDNAAGIAAANTAITTATTNATAAANSATPAGAYLAADTIAANAIQTQAALYVAAGANSAAALATAVAALPGVTAADTTAATAISTAATAAMTAATTAVTTPNAANLAAAQTAFNALNTLTNGTTFTTAGAPALLATFETSLNASNTAVNTAMTTQSTAVAAAIAADPGVVSANAQLATANGLAFGSITSIDPTGLITYLGKDGITTNYYNASGQVGVPAIAANAATAPRLAVVTVANPQGMTSLAGTLFQTTTASGAPAAPAAGVFTSANGTSEKLLSNELEASNVDLGTELVDLLTTQRAYSANSKTITTADQMTQTVLGLIQ